METWWRKHHAKPKAPNPRASFEQTQTHNKTPHHFPHHQRRTNYQQGSRVCGDHNLRC